MILFKKEIDLQTWLAGQEKKGKKAGFVPTMGALHEGHLSLLARAQQENDISVCSIFVNPTQFNDPADYEKYPVTIEQDIRLLESRHCDVLFLPGVQDIYPDGTELRPHYDLGYLETTLEGRYRPGHFQGVCAVVHRLLDIVQPDHLYIGQKDYQQCMVIARLLELTGMDSRIGIRISPTMRETDGLAMSSRNARLDAAERKAAPAIYRSLSLIRDRLQLGDLQGLKQAAAGLLVQEGFRPDYVEIADAKTLEPVVHWDGQQQLVALAAALIGQVRLIDNILLN
ncbi:MAG: pantoate--beta-alanine ligase [Chitinophagaceae bacterium]